MRLFNLTNLVEWLGTFIKFATIGVSNVLIDLVVYWSLTRGFAWWQEHFLLANVVAFIVANFNSFCWNRRWTFGVQATSAVPQYLRFFSASLVYLFVLQLSLWLLVKLANWPDLLAKLVTVGVVATNYFIFLKLIIFKGSVVKNKIAV